MKLKLTNITIADKQFERTGQITMVVPHRDHSQTMIEWLKEHDSSIVDATYDDALKVYVRTAILYGQTEIKYDTNVVFSLIDLHKPALTDQPLNVDMFDEQYETYSLVTFDLKVADELFIDESNNMFTTFDESIEQFIFEALVLSLQIDITIID